MPGLYFLTRVVNMLHLLWFVLYCWLNLVESADKVTYDNYKVFRVSPSNEKQVKILESLVEQGNFDFWTLPVLSKPVDIMVAPHEALGFRNMMYQLDMEPKVYISNVQNLMDYGSNQTKTRSGNNVMDWTVYQELDTIYDWLDSLAKKYPGVISSAIGGNSYEGRGIGGVKMSRKPGRPAIFLEGGIHAREWISPATVTCILNQLLTSNDPEVHSLTERFDFYVFPCVNPDGYVYTFKHDRMWTKTRSPGPKGCFGADPNRNWNFYWKKVGSSDDPCSDKYPGTSAFSEVETRSLSLSIRSLRKSLCMYVSFHSYSQMLLFPYSHTSDRAPNYDELMSVAKKAVSALSKVNGTQYVCGSAIDVTYPASGGSVDWMYRRMKIPYTYTYELRDTGKYGFLLPPSQIEDTCTETFASFVALLQNINCQRQES